jgi:hypothetical protein
MKQGVVQTVLGLLLVASLFVFMSSIVAGYYQAWGAIPGTDRITGVLGNPGWNALMNSRQLLYLVFGLAVLGAGAARLILALRKASGTDTKRAAAGLSATQLLLELLVVGSLIWFIGSIDPGWGSYANTLDGGTAVIMRHDRGWVALRISSKLISLLLALAVVGSGPIGLLAKNRKPATENAL